MYTNFKASQAFVYQTAKQTDKNGPARKDCAAVILYTAEKATRMALDAIQVNLNNACFLVIGVL